MNVIATIILSIAAGFLQTARASKNVQNSQSRVNHDVNLPVNGGIHSVSPSLKYLIATFPDIKTVGYTHLPDTVWRPLYIGEVEKPTHVAVDAVHQRLFVSDQALNKIFVYGLIIEEDGLLKTNGLQRVAVNEMNASYMAVNGVGDLYFSGLPNTSPSATPSWAVYRMDEAKIAIGNVLNPVPIYTQSNSGYPSSAVFKPTGVAVDSFNVYWGNGEQGTTHGALCSGTRQNIGVTVGLEVNIFSKAIPEVRGITVTGQTVYYLSPDGVYGLEKSSWTDTLHDPDFGKIQDAPYSDAKSIAFDGETTLYWTEGKTGIIYSVPASDTNHHPLVKYVDAPQVHGVTVFSLTGLAKSQVLKSETAMYQNSATVVEDSAAHHAWSL
eukprot:CAMPEP_0169227960 /NCGR_PEP_ID=MMETSP1016-20121227/24583_1 /TAXON_ID=342587 /ORGANISM="Karlodinium micrum, Strain CCMP2283" /LENGTH=380 /DNA_ID=CAMNT_0009306715 /DNA_START=73 /DNA_END=1212 /DNA_ORIENTATION=-